MLVVTIVVAAAVAAVDAPAAHARSQAATPNPAPTHADLDSSFGVRGDIHAPKAGDFRYPGDDTLWIFHADFEDLEGDNAGWLSFDMSGTLGQENYWHKDTIRINGFEWLGDSTWWCGTYDPCWTQPRGYGNNWIQILERSFPEVAEHTSPGDMLLLDFDQRFAMEQEYDYGFVDVSTDSGSTWVTVHTANNPGFAGKPGRSQDWDSLTYGHVVLDLSEYAGELLNLRFRFESDEAYSSEDEPNNPPSNSVLDGAWQIDNITWSAGAPPLTFWVDDCESPGDNGWVHEDVPATGQTGITFRRMYDPDTHRDDCPYHGLRGWCMAAVDSTTGRMADGQRSWLVSPPIAVSGADRLVGEWEAWVDCPRFSNDRFALWLFRTDSEECWGTPGGFTDPVRDWEYGGPNLVNQLDDWSAFTGRDWLRIMWGLRNHAPPIPPDVHWLGFALADQRVGVPIGGPPTTWDFGPWSRFHDTFDITEAQSDTSIISISDGDGIVTAHLVATNDAGDTWRSYPLVRVEPGGDDWYAMPPLDLIGPATEIWYYFESSDGTGITRTHPWNAPDAYYEFSVLPITGSVEDPGVLLVDKHGRTIPGEDRRSGFTSEFYYREALDVLGYAYDVYDVEVPSGSTDQSNGPDTSGMKYYDTQIWFVSDFNAYTLKAPDQMHLIDWLSESTEGRERNLLLTGNDIGYELVGVGTDTLSFYAEWLASEYIGNQAGSDQDTMLRLRDAAGYFDFMTHDDGQCTLWGFLCPLLNYFDVVQPVPGVQGAELAAEYLPLGSPPMPAGVAYTHETMGYQTVNLGFGMEFMMDALQPNGYYASGISDRSNLMANIMEYFGKESTGPGTGVAGTPGVMTRLGLARPNPFNPVTTIEYALASPGRVTVRVFDAAGRLVRTLVDGEADAGAHVVAWNGTTDDGDHVASGVYFVRMETDGGYRASRKAVLLK